MRTSDPRWRAVRRVLIVTWGVTATVFALFFGGYGALLVYWAFTFSGEGSLGHVGMYVAAFLFPLLFLFFAGAAWLALLQYRAREPGSS